jgi:hypothetical protein
MADWAQLIGSHRPQALTTPVPLDLPEYRDRPIDFAVDVLGIPRNTLVWSENPGYEGHRWDGTPDPLVVMMHALAAGKDVGIESATGTGKSFTAAAVILWFLACWQGARAFTFAPKEDQLRLYIWAEISKLWPKFEARFPGATFTDLRILMSGSDSLWGAWGYAVGVKAGEKVATNAQGMHAAHMLLVNEETPGIPLPVIEAQRNTVTGDHNLRLGVGNPDSQQDTLHQFCIEPGVVHIRISALDHPNVVSKRELIGGAVTVKSVSQRAAVYGVGSRLYESRIRGISPTEASDALIRAEWIDQAIARNNDPKLRYHDPETQRRPFARALGVDVANSEGGDKAAIARGIGACCLSVTDKPCPDSNILGTEVVTEARADGIDGSHIGVDGVGVGAGTINEGKRLGMLFQALMGGQNAARLRTLDAEVDVGTGKRAVSNVERFASLRAQMYWQARQDLQQGTVGCPNDPELKTDLLTPTWWTQGGTIYVEPKEDIKKRMPSGRSPNKGDAWVYWNWVRPRITPVEDDEQEFVSTSPDALAAELQRTRTVKGRRAERERIRREHSVNDYDY